MIGGFGLGGAMFFGGLLMIAWVLIIGGVMWFVVTPARNNQVLSAMPAPGQARLAILQVLYAKGEITNEQFDQMRRELGA